MVIGTDDSTPYAVRLFPKESCTCPAAGLCYHVIACKLIGVGTCLILGGPNYKIYKLSKVAVIPILLQKMFRSIAKI